MSSNSINTGKIPSYYEWLREDVIAAVPPAAKRVLSVGCAAGKTEEQLVRRGVEVVGVELNREAAAMARGRGVNVIEGDASRVDVNVGAELYDSILYPDILEHLPDPVTVLTRHIRYLKPGGTVYISVPNFRHHSVLWELFIKGHIQYKDAGVLDRTHVRITTRKMVLEWFEMAGLKVTSVNYAISGRKNKVISVALLGLFREFMAQQVMLIGQKK